MKANGKVEVPQEAFMAVLKLEKEGLPLIISHEILSLITAAIIPCGNSPPYFTDISCAMVSIISHFVPFCKSFFSLNFIEQLQNDVQRRVMKLSLDHLMWHMKSLRDRLLDPTTMLQLKYRVTWESIPVLGTSKGPIPLEHRLSILEN
ncbi:hypothetical protein M5K25_026439 [Dendrobium thyrsiflorum]|uniref:Uncharacterized protein n=1 Tax=Dendrobium thyrsiflorum TaxID=117978 RepID=A0ABD0TXB6_DENTH